jgi:hypothetical protein
MDSIVHTVLNKAIIERDESKSETLGPYAVVFNEIIYFAA